MVVTTVAVANILPIIIIFIKLFHCLHARPVLDSSFDPTKIIFRRNFITRELFYKNLTRITSPEPVRRLRLMVGVTQAASESGFVEVYRIKVRWLEPDYWWDNFQGQPDRHYELRCEAEEEESGNTHTFVKMNIDHSIMGYDEHFLTRRPLPLLLICGIRCVNGVGLHSQWVWTRAVKLHKLYNRSPWQNPGGSPMFGHLRARSRGAPSYHPFGGDAEENGEGTSAAGYFPRRLALPPPFDGNSLQQVPLSAEPLAESPSPATFEEEEEAKQLPTLASESAPSPADLPYKRRFPQWEMLKWRNSGGSKTPIGGYNGGGQFS